MEGGDGFVLLFFALFVIVLTLNSLSLGSAGSIVGLNSSKPAGFSIFFIVLVVIFLLYMVYGWQQDGAAGNVLALLMVIGGLISLYNLFTPEETPKVPESSSGFGFSCIFLFVIALLIVGYLSLGGNGGSSSSMAMKSGTVIALLLFAIFAFNFLFASKEDSTPEPSKSTGFPTMLFWFIIIVVVIGFCVMFLKRGTAPTANHNSFDSSSMEMEGDSFVLLFLVLFFVIFALSSLSVPKGTGILARSSNTFSLPSISFFWIIFIVVGLLFAVYASSDASSMKKNSSTDFPLALVMIFAGVFVMHSLFTPKEAPESSKSMFGFSGIFSSSIFWSVVFFMLLLIIVYGTFNGSSSKMEFGTVVVLLVLMVFFAVFALNSLFAPKDSTPEPSKSSGFLSSMFFWSLLIVILYLVMVYRRSSGVNTTNMEGDNYMLMYFALFFIAFVLHYLSTPGKDITPAAKSSTGFRFGPFFWCVLIVIVLLIMAYFSSDAKSMKMEDGTAIMASVLIVLVAVFVLYSQFTAKAAPPPPPPKSSGFLASIVFSPFFWVAGIAMYLAISNS